MNAEPNPKSTQLKSTLVSPLEANNAHTPVQRAFLSSLTHVISSPAENDSDTNTSIFVTVTQRFHSSDVGDLHV